MGTTRHTAAKEEPVTIFELNLNLSENQLNMNMNMSSDSCLKAEDWLFVYFLFIKVKTCILKLCVIFYRPTQNDDYQ